jgi:hypothetical protein
MAFGLLSRCKATTFGGNISSVIENNLKNGQKKIE